MRHGLPHKSCLFDDIFPYPPSFRVSYRKYLSPAACELRQLGLNLRTEPGESCGISQDRSQALLQSWLPFSTEL